MVHVLGCCTGSTHYDAIGSGSMYRKRFASLQSILSFIGSFTNTRRKDVGKGLQIFNFSNRSNLSNLVCFGCA